jgi:type IX secretion system PorP/SprF family membrane protein
MKKNIIYIIVFMSCCFKSVKAQQDATSNHYWVTPSVNNPSLVGISNDSTINISASILDYWAVMPNAPRSINVAVEIPISSQRIAIGAFFHQEEYFLFKESRGSLSFNYKFPISKYGEFRAGLGLGFFESRIDFSGVSIKDLGDGLILDGVRSQIAFQFSFSLAFRLKRFCIGTALPYMITSKNSQLGSVTYGDHNLDSTSFKKPLLISFYVKQSILPKKISQNKHLLDAVLLANINPFLSKTTSIYAPYDLRLNFLYRYGVFVKKKEKKMAVDVLSLDAFKVGLGYRVAWKNSETNGKASHVFNCMGGLEIGRFLEMNYIIGINNSFETIGVTHEFVCKVKIGKRKKRGNRGISNDYSEDIDLLRDEIISIKNGMDTITVLYDSIKIEMDSLNLKTIPSLQFKIDALEKQLKILDESSKETKANFEKAIEKIEEDLEAWKRLVARRLKVDVTVQSSGGN